MPDKRIALLFSVLVLIAVPQGRADEPKSGAEKPVATVTVTAGAGAVFGEAEVEYRFRIDTTRPLKGRVVWRLAAGTATVAAREVELAATPDAPGTVVIKLALPPVKDGTAFHTTLTVSAVEAGARKPIAECVRDVWVFPKDPFAGRTEWLKKLGLSLYDPKGETAKLLTDAKVPFDAVRDLDALAKLATGTVVVGEGVSFQDEKGLGEVLQKLAASGRPVLCLAPAGGDLVVPGVGGPADTVADLSFRKDIVHRLDKRLALDGWPPDPNAVASTLAVKSGEGGAVTGTATPGAGGWPWVEARYESGGRWAVCGHAVVSRWDRGPVPRFLFARALDHLTDTKLEPPKKENAP